MRLKTLVGTCAAAGFLVGPIKLLTGLAVGVPLPVFEPLLLACVVLRCKHASDSGSRIFEQLRPTAMDLCMLLWFVCMVPSIVETHAQVRDFSAGFDSYKVMVSIPFMYFLFRTVADRDTDIAVKLLDGLLKLSIVWILAEFFVVNLFGLNDPIESLVLPVLGGERYFDGLAGTWIKSTGPVPGQQNASILAAIALLAFSRSYFFTGARRALAWAVASGIALLCSITITAVAVLFLVQMLFWHRKGAVLRRAGISIAAALAAAAALYWIEDLLALKIGISEGAATSGPVFGALTDFYMDAISQSFTAFASTIARFPLGLGWTQNGGQPEALLASINLPEAPTEIFLLRVFVFGGLPMVIALIAWVIALGWAYHRSVRGSAAGQITLQPCFMVLLGITFSTMHYPSLQSPGFAVLFAFVAAQLAQNQERHSETVVSLGSVDLAPIVSGRKAG